MEKIRIRDKHPGTTTLGRSTGTMFLYLDVSLAHFLLVSREGLRQIVGRLEMEVAGAGWPTVLVAALCNRN
jgi:hypothetical protein